VSWLEATARWYVVIALCTWAFAPFVRWLCPALADRGATIVRPLAFLAALYPSWLLASLDVLPFDARFLVGTVVVGGAIGWAAVTLRTGFDRAWVRNLALAEAASFALFLGYVWLRGYTPQILGTEKPMDVAFLASSARTTAIPPPDPWFAGEPINYYYLGYLIHGAISRVSSVPPETGFNLALATTFSMTAVAAFGVAWNVIRPRVGTRAAFAAGAFAAFLLAIAGNFYAPWRLVQGPAETIAAWWWDSATGIGWRASRIVCDGPRVGNLCQFPSVETINEFPFFSFLLGDLHPHLMALPFTILAIALAWNLAARAGMSSRTPNCNWTLRLVITGAAIGSLYALNTWDLPTFLIAALFGITIGFAGSGRRVALSSAILLAAAVAAWLPFVIRYTPPAGFSLDLLPRWLASLPVIPRLAEVIAPYAGERTATAEYLTMFGVPYLFGIALLATGAFSHQSEQWRERLGPVMLISLAALVAGVLLAAPVLPLCGIPLTFALDDLARNRSPNARTFALGAYALAWILSIGVELFYVRDVFDNRMNTLFKFYYQTWTLYALATGVTIVLLWEAAPGRAWSKIAVATATALAVVLGFAYPVVASYQWTEKFAAWQGLDGLAYGQALSPGDVEAIHWLSAHSTPGDVILEAAGCSYRPFNRLPFDRISAFTGVPTVIGWDNHERQWRAGQTALLDQIRPRQEGVAAMFADPQSPLFAHYNVRWLVVGPYEAGDWQSECATAGPYPSTAAPGYPGPGWVEAFASSQTRIYRRIDS
jgi:YYY domain-containing protein